MKQIAQDYVDDTQLLVYISPMERLIYVFAEDYGKLTKAVHRLKVLIKGNRYTFRDLLCLPNSLFGICRLK